jgi:hypothetical protein
MIRVASVATLAALLALSLAGCVWTPDGQAGELADRTAIAIADDIAPAHSPEPLSGEHLAWLAISNPRLPPEPGVDYEFDAADWSGNSGDGSGARFVVRISVHVKPTNDSGFVPGREEGRAERCYAFTVRAIPEWQGAVQRSGVGCPDGPYADPQPDDLLVMPADAEDRIAAVLAVATPDDVESLLREQFPDPGFEITSRSSGGELVVTVFVAREPSYREGVRASDGTVSVSSLPHADLIPGG